MSANNKGAHRVWIEADRLIAIGNQLFVFAESFPKTSAIEKTDRQCWVDANRFIEILQSFVVFSSFEPDTPSVIQRRCSIRPLKGKNAVYLSQVLVCWSFRHLRVSVY